MRLHLRQKRDCRNWRLRNLARESAAHSRIHDHFIEQIRQGVFADGKRLPTEAEIAEEFGVSRATVQFAMSRLVWEGWIDRFPGRGTFANTERARRQAGDDGRLLSVAEVKERVAERWGLTEPKGREVRTLRMRFGISMNTQKEDGATVIDHDSSKSDVAVGARATYLLRSIGRKQATEDASKQLNAEQDYPIFVLERLSFVDGRIVESETHSFGPGVLPKFDTESLDVYPTHLLLIERNVGFKIDRIEIEISRLEEGELSERSIDFEENDPLFLVIEKRYFDDGRLGIYSRRICAHPVAGYYSM